MHDGDRVTAYLTAHPDTVGAEWMSTPDPEHLAPYSGGGKTALQILAIGAVGDPAQLDRVRTDLTHRYPGQLCVYPVPYSTRPPGWLRWATAWWCTPIIRPCR